MPKSKKIALVLGASRHIGRAIAKEFAKENYSLILPYFDWPESVQEMIEEFDKQGVDFLAIKADLRNENEVKKLASVILEKYGALDILINNIERGGMPVVHGSYQHSINKDQWELEFDTTIKAKWLIYQNCLPLLRNSSNGCIINISSIAAIIGRSGSCSPLFSDGYSCANKAISSLTESWAKECAPKIRVNELMLGIIDGRHGPGTRGWSLLSDHEKDNIISDTLLKRTGSAKEVAEAVIYLSLKAKYITGTTIRMDGGLVFNNQEISKLPKGILS